MAIYRSGGGQYQSRRKTYGKRAAGLGLIGGGLSLFNRRVRKHAKSGIKRPRTYGRRMMRLGRSFASKFRAAGAIGRMMR